MRTFESKRFRLHYDKNMDIFGLYDRETCYMTPWYTGQESLDLYKSLSRIYKASRGEFDRVMRNMIYGLDDRYTVDPVFSGRSDPSYIARFCGDYIGTYYAKISALGACKDHNEKRFLN